jgi:hypothetical protein
MIYPEESDAPPNPTAGDTRSTQEKRIEDLNPIDA